MAAVFKWTDELRALAIETYKDRIGEVAEEDRPKFTQEIAEGVAAELGCAPNSLRTLLQRAKHPDGTSVYVSKAASKTKSAPKGDGTGSKRRGKAESHADLVNAIQSMAGEDALDMEVISKLTGKAADYITSVLHAISEAE